jgi:L-ribulose-5-phosphate 3-epimerase
MALLLHTMATPELTPIEALELARALGLDGIDLICQADYRSAIVPDASLDEALELQREAAKRGLVIAAMTPYEKRFSSPVETEYDASIAALVHAVDLADALGARSVRLLAGNAVADPDWKRAVARLVSAIRHIADYAAPKGVALNIENHSGTLADTAVRTVEIWQSVRRANVGIVYDPANLIRDGKEHLPESFDLQRAAIGLVHVKDYQFHIDTRAQPSSEATRRSVPVGEGDVPWPLIMQRLIQAGYTGDFSLEYEMRWVPGDLPPTPIGIAMSQSYLKGLWAGLRPSLA